MLFHRNPAPEFLNEEFFIQELWLWLFGDFGRTGMWRGWKGRWNVLHVESTTTFFISDHGATIHMTAVTGSDPFECTRFSSTFWTCDHRCCFCDVKIHSCCVSTWELLELRMNSWNCTLLQITVCASKRSLMTKWPCGCKLLQYLGAHCYFSRC